MNHSLRKQSRKPLKPFQFRWNSEDAKLLGELERKLDIEMRFIIRRAIRTLAEQEGVA